MDSSFPDPLIELRELSFGYGERVILDGVKRNKRRVLIGKDAYVIDSVQRSFPTLYQKALAIASKFGAKA